MQRRRHFSGIFAGDVSTEAGASRGDDPQAFISYSGLGYPLSYFRTHDGVEVDVLLETTKGLCALEIKSSRDWRPGFNSGFRRLREELPGLRCVGVFAGERRQTTDGAQIWPYRQFLAALWDGSIIS